MWVANKTVLLIEKEGSFMNKFIYYYGVYRTCILINKTICKVIDVLEEKQEKKTKESEESKEKERNIKPKTHYNSKGEPMAKIGF